MSQQQQHSSSSAAAQQQQQQHGRSSSGGGGGGGGDCDVGDGSTASLFFAQLSQQHRGPPEGEERPYKNMVDTTSPRLMSNTE